MQAEPTEVKQEKAEVTDAKHTTEKEEIKEPATEDMAFGDEDEDSKEASVEDLFGDD